MMSCSDGGESASVPLRELWKPGRCWRDGRDYPAMVDLPLGVFTMGEHPQDKFASDSERPPHRVEIAHPIAMGKFPVTVREFALFSGGGFNPGEAQWPAAGISWDDAVAYGAWLAAQTGHGYRLPSEAEWEYGASAGQGLPFPQGETIHPAEANYFYDETGNKVGPGRRTPVGAYAANAFGLCDTAGNVCEWVSDAWHANFSGAPVEGESWQIGDRAGVRSRRVLRGGAWDYLPRLLRSSWRDFLPPGTRRDNVGFRVACAMLGES